MLALVRTSFVPQLACLLQVARASFPDRVIGLEEEWGDWLASNGSHESAISHFLGLCNVRRLSTIFEARELSECGRTEKAANAAIAAGEWTRALDILDVLEMGETRAQLFVRIAEHFEAAGDYEASWRRACSCCHSLTSAIKTEKIVCRKRNVCILTEKRRQKRSKCTTVRAAGLTPTSLPPSFLTPTSRASSTFTKPASLNDNANGESLRRWVSSSSSSSSGDGGDGGNGGGGNADANSFKLAVFMPIFAAVRCTRRAKQRDCNVQNGKSSRRHDATR